MTWEVSERNAADFLGMRTAHLGVLLATLTARNRLTHLTRWTRMKEVMSNFFVESYVSNTPTHYYSGVELETATCANTDVAEVGFVGRTLLNAFNALEYGKQ